MMQFINISISELVPATMIRGVYNEARSYVSYVRNSQQYQGITVVNEKNHIK